MDPDFYKTDKCHACKEGGSTESPLHLIFKCEVFKWDRKRIFCQQGLPSCDRLALASPSLKKGNKHATQTNRSKGSHTTLRPANNELAGRLSQVSNSSFNMPHPFSYLNSWTIKQILKFVSVDSLMEVYVPQHKGESGLNYKTASTVVHAAHF